MLFFLTLSFGSVLLWLLYCYHHVPKLTTIAVRKRTYADLFISLWEKENKCKLITMIGRNNLHFKICKEYVEIIQSILQTTESKCVDILLHTYGGNSSSTQVLCNAIREYQRKG